VTVPELGTFSTTHPPIVVITSNRTRDVHDALKRRCLYHWVEHPDFEREVAIVGVRAPQVAESLARQVAGVVEQLRELHLYKPPGVAETIDWAQALAALGRADLDEETVGATLGTVVKYREDQQRVRDQGFGELIRKAVQRGG
jgi:MoxR-like ATPase